MDIIIAGEQGAGKSTAAALLLKALRKEDALEIVELPDNTTHLVGLMQDRRARVILFDECITSPKHMLLAVTAVKIYRERINADVLAVYVAHGSAVMLSDGTGVKRNEFKPSVDTGARLPYESAKDFRERTAVLQANSNNGSDWVPMGRTEKLLVDLWDLLAEKVDEPGSAEMLAELKRLTPDVQKDQAPGLHHLTKEGRIELHTFLLKLLRRYE